MMIFEDSQNIRIEGHTGTWYVVDSLDAKAGRLYELENEQYGDEAAHLIVDEQCNLIMEDVWNGFLEYQEEYEQDAIARQVTENAIMEHMKEIAIIVRRYAEETGSNDKYISLCLCNGRVSFNNAYWNHPDVGVLYDTSVLFPEDNDSAQDEDENSGEEV